MTKEARRAEILGRIKALADQRESALDAIPDSLTDAEYDQEESRIYNEYIQKSAELWTIYSALRFKTTRNEWFKTFAASFQEGQRFITQRQAQVFIQYGEYDNDTQVYGVNVSGLLYTMKPAKNGGHLTVTKI